MINPYQCVCGTGRTVTGPTDGSGHHYSFCKFYNHKRRTELEEARTETGIARHWRESEEMTGIERQEQGAIL